MKISHTFGTFIKEKRQQRDISLRKFADQIGISPVYLSNLENDRMPAPKDEVVSTMARLLLLNDTDTAMLYDLAAKAKSNVTVSQDLPEYIMDKDIVRVALRTAKDVDATDEEWQEFIAHAKYGLLSIDAFDNEDDNGTDYIQAETEDVAETVTHLLMLDKLRSVIPMLSEIEQELIQALFFKGLTEREYAKECGVSQVAIHKRKSRILAKLKIFLEN